MKIRFGVHLGLDESIEETIQHVQRLEKMGLDSVWFADHLLVLNRRGRCLDPWPLIAALAPPTSKIMFGSMVTDPFRRHPAVLAQTLATIDWITGGRLNLGIGAGEAMNVVPFNIPWDHRARRLLETVKVLRLLWKGEAVDFDGESCKLDSAFIQALPLRKEGIPIYIAANSPFTRKLAGKLGDGWIAEMMSPELYRKDVKEVSLAADQAGRSIEDIDIVCHTFCVVSEDREQAKAYANEKARMQFTWWPKQLEKYGYKISERCDWNHILVNEHSYQESKELSSEVPEKIADQITISGNTDDCISKIEKYVDSGVTHFALNIHGCTDETTRALGEKIIPYFNETA